MNVSKKVSGVLAGPRDEGAGDESFPVPEGDDVPAGVDRTTALTAPPAPDPEDLVPSSTSTDAPTDGAPTAEPPTADAATDDARSDDLRPGEPDPVCAAAVQLARQVAVEVAGASVGDHLGVEVEPGADGDAVVTHSFATRDPGYVGWRWAVTVARAQGSDVVTVDEVVLLPGSGALLAPGWVPWSERLQPGDLGPGDLLPPAEDDPRLVPSYADVDADELPADLHRELGLGRPRVLSAEGRADAAQRWYDGDPGPNSPLAKAAPGRCADCGFLVPVVGALGRVFGVCANAMAPDDGRVVALLHGCGAHSETVSTSAHAATTGLAVEHEELLVQDHSSDEVDDLEPADVVDDLEPDDGTGLDDVPADDPAEVLAEAEADVAELPATGDTASAVDEPAAP